MTERVSISFALICEWAHSTGAAAIMNLPGCWERALDAHWWVALNGHGEERKCSRGAAVPPYHAYVEWRGWPAGVIGPEGGVIAAGGQANEDAFNAALRAAIAKLGGRP